MQRSRNRRRADGFTIIELMVAMALSLLLLGGVVAIFASSRASYETTDRYSRIQENGRFALDQLTHDIRLAGYVGCARAPTYLSTSLNNAGNVEWDFLGGALRGYQSTGAGTWNATLPATITPPLTSAAPTSGSDVLLIRIPRVNAQPLRVLTDMASGTDDIVVPNTTLSGLAAGDVAMISSCEAQSYFYVTSFGGGTITHGSGSAGAGNAVGNAVASVNYAYRRNAEVIPVETVVYYVAPSTAGGAGATSLWRRSARNTPEELVEGVEQMQLRFGLDTNGDAIVDSYVDANAVANWANVYSVRLAFLQRSLEQYGTDTDKRTYQLLNVSVTNIGDRRMREVFTTTVSIRNRVPVN